MKPCAPCTARLPSATRSCLPQGSQAAQARPGAAGAAQLPFGSTKCVDHHTARLGLSGKHAQARLYAEEMRCLGCQVPRAGTANGPKPQSSTPAAVPCDKALSAACQHPALPAHSSTGKGDEPHHKGTWPTTAPYQGKGPSRRCFLGWKIPNYLSMQLSCQQDLELKQCWSSLANCATAQFLFSVTKGEKKPQSTE